MATWNPAKDPRYADLYDGGGSSFAQTFLAAQDAIAKQEYNDLLLEEKVSALEDRKKSRGARSAMAEALLQGGDNADFYDTSMRALAEAGDLEGALQMAEAKRKLSEGGDASKEWQQVQTLQKIGESNPEIAAQLWNSSQIGKKYGMKDPGSFTKKSEEKLSGGIIYSTDPMTGKISVKQDLRPKPKEKSGESKKPKESWQRFQDPEGNLVWLNPNDPAQREDSMKRGLKPYGSSQPKENLVEQLMQSLGGATAPMPTQTPVPQRRILVK